MNSLALFSLARAYLSELLRPDYAGRVLQSKRYVSKRVSLLSDQLINDVGMHVHWYGKSGIVEFASTLEAVAWTLN